MHFPYRILILILLFFISCNRDVKVFDFSGRTMGTTYSIKAVSKNNLLNYQKIQDDIDSLLFLYNLYFSNYIDSSEVSIVNRKKSIQYIEVSDIFFDLLVEAKKININTNGAFDITIAPLINLWGFNNIDKEIKLPTKKQIDSTLNLTGSDKLDLSFGKLKKKNPYLNLDFNAIAKGGGVDYLARYFDKIGINDYLIEIGGEVYVSGYNYSGYMWRVGIQVPEQFSLNIISTINVSDVAIATSGTYENYFEIDGINYSHILNPISGKPIKHDLVSATVIAPTALIADALATSFMVMGYDKALDWANNNEDVECYLIRKKDDGSYLIGKTDKFPI